ncbi:glycosyltransferase [Prevotella sp. E9-3]|uniref:glycosyltransferase family 2 protein n=1 Tax=Prevotella sp. E9-3 TaxID=2913621 RepID=UPI001EDBFC21|nr:glycosyltransferase family 2 protein [Prevotella sp. E9-3]UKK49076.1 glycosyltransferase [Prevotella sp. E9-3]
MIWQVIHIIDIVLWLLIACSTFYVVLFSLASLLKRHKAAQQQHSETSPYHFLVVYPAYNEDTVIRHSVATFLQQDYPKELFQLVVVSDHMSEETNNWLKEQPLTLLQPVFKKSSKGKALQYTIQQLGAKDQEWRIVILDADNVVEPDFLSRLNLLCQQGYRAIQCHRTAKNADNDIAALDGLSEEINNTLFRKAHNNIGLSSALIGSGMCFEYEWFAQHVDQLQTAVEDRELESLLLIENIYIHYAEDIYVMDEKVCSGDNFQRQRLRWMTGQVQSLISMLPHLPQAIIHGNVNYIDKTIQQALIPRSLLLVIIPFISLLILFISPIWSIKWWALLASLILSISIAIPSKLRNKSLWGKLISFPKLVWRMAANVFQINHKDTSFIHTSHSKTNNE